MNKCLLCHEAPCSKVCNKMNPEKMLRADRFDNAEYAISNYPDELTCVTCDGHCEEACMMNVPIKKSLQKIYDNYKREEIVSMNVDIDLSCDI